jgi:nucleotide-binding universal stress UspA family protein
MHFARLLVPLDGAEVAAAALPAARLLARATGAEVTLVMVAPPGTQPGSTRAMRDYLHSVATAERAAGLTVHTTVRLGDPASAIVHLGREIKPNLIIMATHGRSGLERTILGSVTDKVVRASSAPVLVLRPCERKVERFHTVLVPMDGTQGGTSALATALPLATDIGARLVLVRAVAPPPSPLFSQTLRPGTLQQGKLYVEHVASRLRQRGMSVEARGVIGQPGTAIVALAEDTDADLIVMSTHGRRGPTRSILGSVADEVVRHSRRPVLLVTRSDSADQDCAFGTSVGPSFPYAAAVVQGSGQR